MTEEIKKAFKLAEKELEENKINKIKEVVKRTLEKIEDLGCQKKDLEEKIKVLKLDIDDLKAGRLDKIEERQKKSELAKETSVIVIREKQITGVPCQVRTYIPYWQRVYEITPIYYDTCTYIGGTTTVSATDCSSNVTGTYTLSSGTIKYL